MKKERITGFLKGISTTNILKQARVDRKSDRVKALGFDITSKTNTRKVLQNVKTSVLTPLGENLPTPSQLKDGWLLMCDEFPEFTQKELYNYLVLSKHRSYADSEMGARRQLKASVLSGRTYFCLTQNVTKYQKSVLVV